MDNGGTEGESTINYDGEIDFENLGGYYGDYAYPDPKPTTSNSNKLTIDDILDKFGDTSKSILELGYMLGKMEA